MTADARPAPRLTARGAATRARIVDAASGLMFEKGASGTSVEDVQRAAGVSASQLYHYFTDKRALTRAVIEHQTDAVLEAQQPLLERLDSVETLRAWRDRLVDLQRQRHCHGGCPIGSLSSELADTDDEARRDVLDGFARWQTPIAAGLEAMRERGELPDDTDTGRLATAMLAAVQGGLLLTQARRDPAPLADALDTMIEHVASLCAGSGRRPRRRSG